jgi:catechol 2,3-dioxygenase-like lactoylglutathione lyase family enzyme
VELAGAGQLLGKILQENAGILRLGERQMKLGAFSISLAVKDIAASRAFYEKLGFEQVAGNPAQKWLILRNGETTIGLFQGMFERNMLTFNPGWTGQAETLTEFADVREIQQSLKASGLALTTEADESATGPASVTMIDPDGNPILIDQHVDSPANLKSRKAAT